MTIEDQRLRPRQSPGASPGPGRNDAPTALNHTLGHPPALSGGYGAPYEHPQPPTGYSHAAGPGYAPAPFYSHLDAGLQHGGHMYGGHPYGAPFPGGRRPARRGVTAAALTIGVLAAVVGGWGTYNAVSALVGETSGTPTPTGDPDGGSGQPTGAPAPDDVVPVGETFAIGDWKVTIHSTNTDASSVVLAENRFNGPPQAGHHFVLADITARYVGDDEGDARFDLRFAVVGGDAIVIEQHRSGWCGVIPNQLGGFSALSTGQASRGNICVQAPADQLDGAVWQVTQRAYGSPSPRKLAAMN